MNNIWILAQVPANGTNSVKAEPYTGAAETKQPSDANAPPVTPQRRGAFDVQTMIFIALMFVLMYVILFRGPRKKQQEHRKMVQSLEKNDKVRTIGGIIGTVVDIKGDEITLKVDESNNTKIKVIPSAIGKNLSKDKENGD
jgi:preprotein translocase subunit YajC